MQCCDISNSNFNSTVVSLGVKMCMYNKAVRSCYDFYEFVNFCYGDGTSLLWIAYSYVSIAIVHSVVILKLHLFLYFPATSTIIQITTFLVDFRWITFVNFLMAAGVQICMAGVLNNRDIQILY